MTSTDAPGPAAEVESPPAPTTVVVPRSAPMDTVADPNAAAAPRVAAGTRIGRYVVMWPLAEGGMGVVLVAYDPKLDRKVAIKMLRASAGSSTDPEGYVRLLREAQAMARLRHPNVVTVFEVGEHEGRVFIAMEYVGGGTLRGWARERSGKPGAWAQIVAGYVEAGRGLAAAHAAGLVHRDFKPDNVLVEDGRIQVTDFGIVSSAEDTGGQAPEDGLRLTSAGVVMGTIPYMAPEQHDGQDADVRSDQFSFCVALYEALYGRRPFGGDTLDDVRRAARSGVVPPVPSGCDVPLWVERVIRRGLSRDPAERWPSMDALLRVLGAPEESDIGRRARVAFGAVAGLVLMVVPFTSRRFGIPFDGFSYRGVVAQTIALALVGAVALVVGRASLLTTAFNRRALLALWGALALQIPFTLGHAALGLPIATSQIQQLFYWCIVTTMFAITVERRFLALSAVFLVAYPSAIAWPDHHGAIVVVTNLAFVACVVLTWRAAPRVRG